MNSSQGRDRSVAALAGPRMPADHGLASLGLLMQLGGSIFAAVGALFALLPLFMGGAPGAWVIFLIGALSAVRSAFHRGAGTALLYGAPRGPMAAVRRYVAVAGAQTVATLLLLWLVDAPLGFEGTAALVALLMAWPAALSVMLRVLGLHDLSEIPVAEDSGFEGAAVLMTLLGITGALAMSLAVLLIFKLPGAVLSSPPVLISAGVMILLVVRSVLHVLAGVKGTRGADADQVTYATTRYISFGIVSSVIAAAALLLQMMTGGMHPLGLLVVGMTGYLLLLWPLALRRFYTERNFDVLLAGEAAPVRRRAPDAGLTSLGWLLLAMGVLGLSASLFQTWSHGAGAFGGLGAGLGASGADWGYSVWWSVGQSALQLWAGFELITMSDRFKTAGLVYGAVSTVVTLYLYYPVLGALDRLGGAALDGGLASLLVYAQIAIALVLPVGTIVLVNRQMPADATARVRG